MKLPLLFPLAYLLGFWCFYLSHPVTNYDGAFPYIVLLDNRSHLSSDLENKLRNSTNLECACDGISKQLDFIIKSQAQAHDVLCNDEAAAVRDFPPPSLAVIGACALRWITSRVNQELDPTRPQIVFDYGYNGMAYNITSFTNPKWVFLTALLPEQGLRLPPKRVLAQNQMLLARPTVHRLRSLFTTNSLFDVQFALRMDELAEAAGSVPLAELVSGIIGMARRTYIILPRNSTIPGLMDTDVLKAAIRKRLSNVMDMGLHQLDVQVSVAAIFRYKETTKQLLRVEPLKIHRGVRLKWCYYPLGTKYDLIYRRGDMIQLVHRYILQWTRFGGDKVKTIRKWHPSINMGDILGWGLGRQQRELLLWDMLTQPSCPDPAIQNWLLTRGGRVVRIDSNQQAWKNKHPTGRHYVEFLRLFLCIGRGVGWRQQFDRKLGATCVSCPGGSLIHVTADGRYKFFQIMLHERKDNNQYVPTELGDAVANNEHPECPACNRCVMHAWRILKLVWHNNRSLPPSACHECYECQRARLLGGGISLDVDALHGCTDVEGVSDDGADRPEYCYDVQSRPIPRPSASADAIKKGPY
jgi:hypothetical protein